MEITAIIPARGGSQGIENKNVQMLGGKALVCWTVEAALKSKISKVIVSTDSANVRSACAGYRGLTFIDQPSPMKDGLVNACMVLVWYLRQLNDLNMVLPDGICMLLPTSPLRTERHINGAVDKFEKCKSVVISVCPSKALHSLRRIKDERLVPITEGKDLNAQRQDVEQLYEVNGSIYIAKPELLLKHESFHIPAAVPFRMAARYSIDINDQQDLDFVRKMF